MARNYVKEVKQWENGLVHWDLTEESKKINPMLMERYGRDPFSFKPETTGIQNYYLRKYEGPMSHGYPLTAWL